MDHTMIIAIVLIVALWMMISTTEGYVRSRGCPAGKVWDGTRCRYPGMKASGVVCPEGMAWDPIQGNCNYPKYLRNRGRECVGGKVWDGTRCRYPGMEASGVVCPGGMSWNQDAGQCEYTELL